MSVDGHILDLVVVNNIGFRICIRELVDMLLRRRAMTSYDTFHIDNLELTILRFTPQDVESSVVEFRLGDPCNIDMTCLLDCEPDGTSTTIPVADHPDGSRVWKHHRDVHRS